MEIRITGISTPFEGTEWEYTDNVKNEEYVVPFSITPDQKIKVFISSKCGDNGKYDRVRVNLKKVIEDTKLADVYLFEEKEASTLSATDHYIWALEDSDVCIFLIDNEDGVTPGVQKEIDTAKRCGIKSLYYFCDERTKEKTPLEQSLMGATYAKSKTVHRFEDLSQDGARALINDIVNIYRNYCRGRLVSNSSGFEESFNSIGLSKSTSIHIPTIPKTVVNNIDKCKDYIQKLIFGFSARRSPDKSIKTSELDEWGEKLLTVLFESMSIKNFNMGMFLEHLKKIHDETYFSIVSIRWQAIQAYFLGHITKCIDYLGISLKLAKESFQPSWVIQDILIDLRNEQWTENIANNCFTDSSAQKELSELEEDMYYPVLDRIYESLREKYIDGLYKMKTESPYTITWGSNYDQCVAMLASAFIVSIYNGSLTHILLFYDKIKEFLFYLCCKHDDWKFRKDMLKLAIFAGNEKEIKGIQEAYPEVLNEMNEKDAVEIMRFCENHSISYRRISSKLLAFGTIGYYLNEQDYKMYEKQIINTIKEWLNEEHCIVAIGHNVFICLTGISFRMHQDLLAEICCLFIDKHYSRWYMDMFKFIANRIDLNKMSEKYVQLLVQHILTIFDNEQDLQQIKYAPEFLYILRKQNQNATTDLDFKISKYLPEFYNGSYKLETTSNQQDDFPEFIRNFIRQIEASNASQGKNGHYFGHSTRDIATIRAMLLSDGIACSADIMDSLISAVSDTLLVSKEEIDIKLDAISLLLCIVVKCPNDYFRNKSVFNLIIEKKDEILDIDNTLMLSNIDKVSLEIALALLLTSMGGDGYIDFVEGLSRIQNDKATSLSVLRTIINYFEIDDSIVLPKSIETVVLQNALQWLKFDYIDIKWNATKILFMLMRNPENSNLVNQKVIELIDTECFYIKNLILRHIYETDGLYEKTRDYVIAKCENDPCSIVRDVCAEVRQNQNTKK